jgi:hypothetical protein
MSAGFRIFLDDEREPKTAGCWAVARNFDDAVSLCVPVAADYISFDHDLGDGPTGYDFARWLVDRDLEQPGFIPANFSYNVHSANVVGRANIEGLLDGYLKQRAEPS